MSIESMKRAQMEHVAEIRHRLWQKPDLCWLFFELTTRCNLHCRHCGSHCSHTGADLQPEMVIKALKGVDPSLTMIAITGGEPMLHPQFYEMMQSITERGFRWGITTNATLIDDQAAHRLKEAGLRTVSVSLDGLEVSHDVLRGHAGAWRLAMNGVHALQRAGFDPQITTVVHPRNLHELQALEKVLQAEGIHSWRIINVEPIGRARGNQGLMLSPEQFRAMLDFIRERSIHGEMDVSFGCSHYLGLEMERMVRDHYFLCGAGITVASIRSNGDICACLDIENRPELVQGNIHTEEFMDVWMNRFEFFRQDRTERSETCRCCPDREICAGDSTHTWDFDRNEPLLCGKAYTEGIL